jgi:GntR family histidine utilization transcriptional repressor
VTPLHQRIFEEIEANIMSGAWKPGQRVPTEQELVEQYHCSRMTVSKALTVLARRGMIVRHRRNGTFVKAPQIDRTVMDIQDIGVEAQLAGHEYSYSILTRNVERLTLHDAQTLAEVSDTEVLRLQCLHIVDGRPNAIERRLIMLDAVPSARNETFASIPPGVWLLQQVPWTEAKHIIRAIPADGATAQLLELQRGEPCLSLTRQTWQNGRTVTHVEVTHPGDRYQFAGVFRPSAQEV